MIMKIYHFYLQYYISIDNNYNYYDKDILFLKIKEIKNYIKNDIDIIKYLQLNIIIFDFKNKCIKTLYDGDYFNPYIETVFIANYDNYWEPICSKEYKLFNINQGYCNIFKNKILTLDIKYYDDSKIYLLNDNIIDILDNTFDIKLSENESFTTKNTIYSNLTKNKLNKMNKNNIIEIIHDLNIDISKFKKPTKAILINLILNK